MLVLSLLSASCGDENQSKQATPPASTATESESTQEPGAEPESAADTAPGADTAEQARVAVLDYQGNIEYGNVLPREGDPEYNYYERKSGKEDPLEKLDGATTCSLPDKSARQWVIDQVVPRSSADRKVEYLEAVSGDLTRLYWRYRVSVPSDALPADGSAPEVGEVQTSGMLILNSAGQPVYGERSDLMPPSRIITAFQFIPPSPNRLVACGLQR